MLELKEFIDNANKLFTIPDICLSLNELVAQDNCSVEDIAAVVSHDPALCVRILKLANSALYRRKAQVSSVEQAIQIVGTDELCNIAIATSAALIFKGAGEHKINLSDYWHHSVYTAVISQKIYKECFKQRQGPLFVVGLLHNLGMLVVLERLPYFRIELCHHIGVDKRCEKFEKRKLGFHFSDVAAGLLQHWNLPNSLIEPIANQHIHQPDSEHGLALRAGIKIADAALSKIQPMELALILQPQEVELLGLDQQTLDEIIEFTDSNIQSVIDIIQG